MLPVLAICLSAASGPAQTILRVPDDYSTIQSAVNAAKDGDVVLVASGFYPESVKITNRITLTGADASCGATIDGQGAAAAIDFNHASGAIENVTAQNATAGISVEYCGSVGISNCVVQTNIVYGISSGWNGLLTVDGCTIRGNPTLGINSVADDALVSRTIICGNANGVMNHQSANWQIVNSLIQDSGEAIRIWGTHLVVANCDLISNAVALVYMEDEQAFFLNDIVWGNQNPEIDVLGVGSLLCVCASLVDGGQSVIKVETGASVRWIEGNLDGDPDLVFQGGWPCLSPESPCLGSGSLSIPGLPAVTTVPAEDALGSPRPSPPGTMPDMGAVESGLGGPVAYIPAGLTFETVVGSNLAQEITVSNSFTQIGVADVPAGIQVTNVGAEITIDGQCDSGGSFQSEIWITNQWGVSTNQITFAVGKAPAAVILGNQLQTYDGTAEAATATTAPPGLVVDLTYNSSVAAPTNPGSYTVTATINDSNYQGSATNTLVIGKATGIVALGNLSQVYDGTVKATAATTAPAGLAVNFLYNGLAIAPTNAGSYTVVGTISDSNYQGSATNTLVIGKAAAIVLLGNLSQTYDGTARNATAATTPGGLAVNFTYNGVTSAPTNPGAYTVVGTINDVNYQGSATGTLVILPTAPLIVQEPLSQSVEIGTNVTLEVLATGSPLYYQWFSNGGALDNAAQASLAFHSIDLTNAGTYFVVVSNALGTATSSNAVLAVRPPGAPIVRVDGQLVVGSTSQVGSAILSLESGFANGISYYTLDGSTPDFGSAIYNGPITLTSSAVVNALGLDVNSLETAQAPPVAINITPLYSLMLVVQGAGTVTANPSPDPYLPLSVVSMSALADSGWVFDDWSGDASGNTNPLTLTMSHNESVVAVFVPLYTVTASTPGGGGVSPAQASWASNSVASLTATAESGWTFLDWTGDGSGTNNPLSLTVDGPMNVVALFGTSVGSSVIGSGQIELSPANPIAYGATVQATAIPSNGSYFVQWGGACSGTNNPTQFVVTTKNPVHAVFGLLQTGQAALTVKVVGLGTVQVAPSKAFYAVGESVTLTAVPQIGGSEFQGWSGDVVSQADPLVLTLDTSKVLTATFGPAPPVAQIWTQGGMVQLSWPLQFTNYTVLVSKTLSGTNWSGIIGSPVVNGTNLVLTLPATDSQMFFRLGFHP